MKRIAMVAGSLFLTLLAFLIIPNYHSDRSVDSLKEKYTNSESKFMNLNGMSVHYRDEGGGPVLLLLHGTAASLHTWDAWTDMLKSDFRVVRLDLPAFGLTGPSPDHDYRIATYADFLDAFCEQLDIDSAYVAGNSLGGRIAATFAMNYPKRVSRLILIDASGMPIPDNKPISMAFQLAQTPVVNKLLTVITPKSLHRKSLLEVYADDSLVDDKLVDRYFEMMLRAGNREAFVARANSVNPPFGDELTSLEIPVLILWGEDDTWIPVADAHKFDRLIPNSKLIIYPDAGHVPMEEIPQKTAEDARGFLF